MSRSGRAREPYAILGPLLAALVLFGLALPASMGLIRSLVRLQYGLLSGSSAPLTVLALAFVGLVSWLLRVDARKGYSLKLSRAWFLALGLGIPLVLRAVYVALADVQPVSDFNAMWRAAVCAVERGSIRELGFCLNGGVRSPWVGEMAERTLVMLYPLAKLLGPSAWSYRLGNLLAVTAATALTYDVAQRWFGEREARWSVLLLACVPESYLAVAIPTHDIPGSLLLVASVALLERVRAALAGGHVVVALALSTALAACVTALELQRGLALFVWCLAGWYVLVAVRARAAGDSGGELRSTSPPGVGQTDSVPGGSAPIARAAYPRTKRVLLALATLVVLPLTLQQLALWSLGATGAVMSSEERELTRSRFAASSSDSWGPGTWFYGHVNYRAPYRSFAPDDWRELARRKLISDGYYNPADRLPNMLFRANSLFDLGSLIEFYRPQDGVLGQQRVRLLTSAWSLFFLGALLFALRRLLRGSNVSFFSSSGGLVLVSSITLALLIAGESQSRYLFLLWFVGAPYLALAFLPAAALDRAGAGRTPSWRDSSRCVARWSR